MGQLRKTLSQYWDRIQDSLFPWLEETLDPLTETQQQLVTILARISHTFSEQIAALLTEIAVQMGEDSVRATRPHPSEQQDRHAECASCQRKCEKSGLELVRIEQFLPNRFRYEGRPPKTRYAIARSFVAKMVYNIETTTMLIERLQADKSLRRICGWENRRQIPSESTFSRAFADFTEMQLPQNAHEALVKNHLSDEIISHNSRDSTAIEARETIKRTPKIEKPAKKKKGRCKKGEEGPRPELTRIERQRTMKLEEMIKDLPNACDKGAKKDSKGNVMYWNGYKLHTDTIDGDIPVSAIVTSASVHDSQVAIPLATMTVNKVVTLYDLMDAAYDVPDIIEHSQTLGHVPLIDKNPRRDLALQEAMKQEANPHFSHFL
jgi:hypothetical protein